MKKFKVKEGTHLVFKESDVSKHLTKEENNILSILYEKVIAGRKRLGKKENKYYVVNLDEPYSGEVLEVIKKGETSK